MIRALILSLALVAVAGCDRNYHYQRQDKEACERQPDLPWCKRGWF